MVNVKKLEQEHSSLTVHLEDYLNNEDSVEVNDFNPKKKLNVLEVFAGAGGLLLGLEKANMNTVAAIEIDKHACSTLRKNIPNLNVIEDSIENVVGNGIDKYLENTGNIDILSGGYPCQSFSYAGKRLGISDTRGTLFYYYAKLLSQIKPKIFIAENVKGLVSHDQGRTLQVMIDIFEKEGYKVTYKVLNSNDYDVAQKRQRIFIIGIRNDIYTKPFKFPKEQEYKPVLRDALLDVPDSPGKVYPRRKKEILDMVPPGGYWRDLPVDIQKEYMKKSFYLGGGKTGMARRISWDEPSLTLTTSPDMKQTERCHPEETRPFTTREYARIQSFPDNWIFEGPITSIYKQIGNAVPVNLAKYIGLSVQEYLKNEE